MLHIERQTLLLEGVWREFSFGEKAFFSSANLPESGRAAILFLAVLEAGSQGQGAGQAGFALRPLPLACRPRPSPSVLSAALPLSLRRESLPWCAPLYKGLGFVSPGPRPDDLI